MSSKMGPKYKFSPESLKLGELWKRRECGVVIDRGSSHHERPRQPFGFRKQRFDRPRTEKRQVWME